MNLNIPIGGLLLTAAFVAPAASAAEVSFISCHGCSASQARRAAEGAVPMTHPPGIYEVYTADAPGNKLRRFRVTAEREPGSRINVAAERSPANRYRREFREGRAEWAYVRQTAAAGIEIPAGFPVDNAEQVIGSAFNQRVISEQINRNVPARIGSLFGSALLLFREIFTAEIQMTVTFPDGSSALFYLDRVDSFTSGHTFVYRYKPGSARDSDGNAIPDSVRSLSNYQGFFTTEPNWERFKRRAQRYGADLEALLRSVRGLPTHTVCARGDDGEIFCWMG